MQVLLINQNHRRNNQSNLSKINIYSILNDFYFGFQTSDPSSHLSLVSHLSLGCLGGKSCKIKTFFTKTLTRSTAIMSPNRPMALPKISTMRILTNKTGLAASDRAAPDPTQKLNYLTDAIISLLTCPTQSPHTRFVTPVQTPAPNIAQPEK